MNPKNFLRFVKFFLFLFNLLFFFLGILLLAFSFWVLFDRQSFAAALGSPLLSLRFWSYGFSGLGVVTMILGFLGCLGALKEVKVMLGLYFGLLLLLLAAQIAAALIAYTQRAALAAQVGAFAQGLIRGYPPQGLPKIPHESWDWVQHQFGCCGWTGPRDWDQFGVGCSCLRTPNSTHGTPGGVPQGRCPPGDPRDIFARGCRDQVWAWLARNLVTVVGVSVGIGLGELSLLMLSMFLVRNLGPSYERLLRGL